MGGGKRRVETGDPDDINNNMIINQMMLRFRPIAPRPVTVESSVGLVPVKENIKRAKRKYVRVKKKNMMTEECNYNYNSLTVTDDNGWLSLDRTVTTLAVTNGSEFVTDPLRKVPEVISFNVSGNNNIISRWITPATTVKRRESVESWITVESVTGTCEDGRKLQYYYTDLETDSCPGFISNSCDEVRWVNPAYRRMVDPNCDGGAPPPEVVVWLVVKVEKIAFEYQPAFSCRVRVVYDYDMSSPEKKQMTVPCDVWKMDSGEYAWRLDVKAALSLGRLN